MNIPLSPEAQVLVYLLQFAVVAAGSGCLTLHLPRVLPIPRLGRFLLGMTLAPFTIGAVTGVLGTIVPGGPGWVFYWLPSLLACVPLIVYGRRSALRLVRAAARARQAAPAPALAVGMIGLALAAALLGVGPRLWANAWAPVSGHDALLYASKAAKFAEQRTSSVLYGLRGDPAGTTREESHGLLYPAFLGHAMLTASNGEEGGQPKAGPPNDYAVRFAFQVSFPLMLLAVVALASSYRLLGVGALAVILLLMVGRFEYVSFQSSRDAYRIIPILLYSTLLIGLSPARLRARVHPSVLLPLFLLPIAALYGHTLGGIIAAISTVVWTGCVVVRRAPFVKVVLLLGVIGLGFAAGSMRYFELYLAEGLIQGYASVESTVKGTVLAPILQASRQGITQTGLMERLALPFAIDSFRLSLPGIAAALASLWWWWRRRNERHTFVFLLVGLTVLAIFLPLTGLLDYSGYRISRSFVRNARYTLHWYPYAAVGLAGLLLAWHRALLHGSRAVNAPKVRWAANGVLAGTTVAATIMALLVIDSEWRMRQGASMLAVAEITAPVRVMVEQLVPGKHWLLDDDRYNYNLGNEGLVMYTRATWPVVKAQSPAEAETALDALGIDAVALLRRDIPNWWGELPFYDLLADPQEAVVLSGDAYLVFDRAHTPEAYGRQVRDYLEAAGASGPAMLFGAEQAAPVELNAAGGVGETAVEQAAVLALTPHVKLVLADTQYALAALAAAQLEDPADAGFHLARGHIYSVLGDPTTAFQEYALALAGGGERPLVQRFMAAARSQEAQRLAGMGQLDAALAALRAAVELDPTEPLVLDRMLTALRTWGSQYSGDIKAALATPLRQAIQAGNTSSEAYIVLAGIYAELGQQEASSAAFRQVLALWPEDEQVLHAVARAAAAARDWDTATLAYEQLIRRNPSDPGAYAGLAEVYVNQWQKGEAIALYQEAAQANPDMAWPHLELGKLYQRQTAQQP